MPRSCGAAGRGAAGYLSRLQRRILCRGGSGGHAGRADRRGHSLGPAADGAPARAGSSGCFVDVAAGIRHAARTSPSGYLILLENQNRLLWNREQIAEGVVLLRNPEVRRFGSYTLQAAIAAVHAEAESITAPTGGRLWRYMTNWYEFTLRRWYSSIVPWHCHVRWARGRSSADRRVLEQGELANYQSGASARPICTAGSQGG